MNMRIVPIVVVSALLPTAAVAQSDSDGPVLPRTRWAAELGAFLSDFDTSLRLSGPTGGTEINLEDALGLDTQDSTFRGQLSRRFGDRHRVTVGFYDFRRSSRAVSAETIVIETEDNVLEFEAGATIETEFDWRLFPITYVYSFSQSDRFEAAVSAGVHWADVDVAFRGEATVNGEIVADAVEAESSSAPLPVFGLEAAYALTDRIVLGGRAQYFGLEIDDVSGDLTDLRFTGEYYWSKNFATGIGYTWYDINYDETNGAFSFDLNYNYQGFEAFVNFRF